MSECGKAHYRMHREKYAAGAWIRMRSDRKKLQRLMIDHLAAHPSVDCGRGDLVVLDFAS